MAEKTLKLVKQNVPDDPSVQGIEDAPWLKDNDLSYILSDYYEDGIKLNDCFRDEREWLREQFRNSKPVDYYGLGDDRLLYRSGMVGKEVRTRTALLLESKPRFFLNPVMKEDAFSSFVEGIKVLFDAENANKKDENNSEINKKIAPYAWLVQELKRCGGSISALVNKVSDFIVQDWWERAMFDTTLESIVQNSLIDATCWGNIYRRDDKIFIEEVLAEDVIYDYASKSYDNRRYVMFRKKKSCREIEREWELPEGSVGAEDEISDYVVERNEKQYSEKRAYVYEAQIRLTKDGVAAGIYAISFLRNQPDYECGIRILKRQKSYYSNFTLVDLSPLKETTTLPIPFARDIAPLDGMDTRVIQQHLKNFIMVGNSKIIYEPGGMVDTEGLSNLVAQRIPVNDANTIQFHAGTPIGTDALALHSVLWQTGKEQTGHTGGAESGTSPRLESSKALMFFNETMMRQFRPSLHQIVNFLKRIFTIWSEMLLEIHKANMPFRYGRGLKDIRRMHVSLAALVESFDVAIDPDTQIPKDPQSMANLIMTLAQTPAEDRKPMIPRSMVLEYMAPEQSDEVNAYYNQINAQEAQIQQLQQGIEQAQMIVQQAQKEYTEIAAERDKLVMDKKSLAASIPVKMALEKLKREGITETTKVKGDIDGNLLVIEKLLNKLLENSGETGGDAMSKSAAENILRALQPGGDVPVETEVSAPGGITGMEMDAQAVEPGLEEMIAGSPEGETELPETSEPQSPELDEMIVGEAAGGKEE